MEIWPPDDNYENPVGDSESTLDDVLLYKHVTNCADPECEICGAL